MSKQNTTKKIVSGGAPKVPETAKKLTKEERQALPITDPRRRLTKTERKALTPEQRKERKAAILARRGPAKLRFVKLVTRTAKRIERIAKAAEFRSTDEVTALMASLTKHLEALPADWKPARSTEARERFESGTMVQIKEDQRARFADLIPSDELDGLVVVKSQGRDVLVRSESGVKLFVGAKHLEVAGS